MRHTFFCHLVSRKSLLILLVTLSLTVITVSQVAAFADTFISSYTWPDVINSATGSADATYAPSGNIGAGNLQNNWLYHAQYVQAHNRVISWTPAASANVRSNWDRLATVSHVFQTYSGNCAAPFTYDGVWVASQADAWIVAKNATCFGGYTNYNNEARVYWYANEVVAGPIYQGGAEFALANGDLYATGHTSNDIYFERGFSVQKDRIQNGTWCFDSSSVWHC